MRRSPRAHTPSTPRTVAFEGTRCRRRSWGGAHQVSSLRLVRMYASFSRDVSGRAGLTQCHSPASARHAHALAIRDERVRTLRWVERVLNSFTQQSAMGPNRHHRPSRQHAAVRVRHGALSGNFSTHQRLSRERTSSFGADRSSANAEGGRSRCVVR
jgi:hypothetical protein